VVNSIKTCIFVVFYWTFYFNNYTFPGVAQDFPRFSPKSLLKNPDKFCAWNPAKVLLVLIEVWLCCCVYSPFGSSIHQWQQVRESSWELMDFMWHDKYTTRCLLVDLQCAMTNCLKVSTSPSQQKPSLTQSVTRPYNAHSLPRIIIIIIIIRIFYPR